MRLSATFGKINKNINYIILSCELPQINLNFQEKKKEKKKEKERKRKT
jgi:hypothetical protein